MKKTKTSLTIAIPAYNEQRNIGYLLADLCRQDYRSLRLENIFVISDASTDRTNEIVQKLAHESSKIKLIAGKTRRGKDRRQNQIMLASKSDILVILDSDIRIKDPKFIKKLVQPIAEGIVDLTSAKMRGLDGVSWTEKILVTSLELKNYIFDHYKSGDNVYSVHGPAKAYCRRLYKSIRYPGQIGEDAFTYFFTKKHNWRYKFIAQAEFFIRVPANLHDQQMQSSRFYQSSSIYKNQFGAFFLLKHYWLPILDPVSIIRGINFFVKNPIHTIAYIFLTIITVVRSLTAPKMLNLWDRV